MPTRILLLITDLKIGGTPIVVRELAVRLAADPEFHVHVACLDRAGPVAGQLKSRGIPVTSLNATGRFDLGIIPRLLCLLRTEKIDTVFSFLIHANAAAAAASYFTSHVRFFQSIQTTQPTPRWHWKLQHVIAHRARRIIVPTPSVAEAARQWADIEPSRLLVIPNAIEPAEFANLPHQPGSHRIGFIGRLDPIKRIEDLIAAIPLLDESFTVHIFGEGPQRSRLQSMISRLGLEKRATLHGEIPSSPQALAQIDMLVLPSAAEGFGLVLIEALAADIPVIATNVRGIRDVIQNRITGLLVPPQSPQSIAAAVQEISQNSPLRESMIKHGRQHARERFTWATVLPSYREILISP